MTMTVQVRIREDSEEFHGWIASAAVEGEGSMKQFLEAWAVAQFQALRAREPHTRANEPSSLAFSE